MTDITLEEAIGKLKNEHAKRYVTAQAPKNPKTFPEMLDSLNGARVHSEERFKEWTMLYILDMQNYPRADVSLAVGTVEREHGR